MFDLTILIIPLLATGAVFATALFIGEEIVIDKVEVSHQLEWTGYSTTVATRELTDEIRELNEAAASELANVGVDETSMQKGISAFEDYLQIQALIDGARDTLGLIPYYVEGEITESGGKVVMVARVFASEEDEPTHVISVVGDPNNIRGLLHDTALGIVQTINPYLLVLYWRQTEAAAQQYDFPKTNAAAESFFATRPVEEHYSVYGLLGRAHMLKAQRDPNLTPEQRHAEFDRAINYLNAALRQKPDFLFPLINLGLIYELRGETALAEEYYAKAVEANPNYMITRSSWAEMLVKQGRLREAIIQYVAAVEIAPGNDTMRDKLAQLYVDVGRPDAARAQWEEALMINPTNVTYADRLRALNGGKECLPGLEPAC